MIAKLLSVPSHERRTVASLFMYSALLATSYTCASTASDSLFLSRVGGDDLATLFLASGVATILVTSLWFLLVRRVSLAASLRPSAAGLAVLTLLAWWFVPSFHSSVRVLGAIYLLTQVRGCVNAINVVSAMNELLGRRSSRHAWAVVGLGLPIAGIITGAVIGLEANIIQVRDWLLVAAILDIVICFTAPTEKLVLSPSTESMKNTVEVEMPVALSKKWVVKNPNHFRIWIAILVAAQVVVLTVVTFDWKIAVSEYYEASEQGAVRYFGIFYCCVGFASLIVQAMFTGKILTHHGVRIPLMLMPLTFLVMSFLLAVGPGALGAFVIASLAKSMDFWRRSVHDTALNVLYTALRLKRRRGMIFVNGAVVKPLAEIGTAVYLVTGTIYSSNLFMVVAASCWSIAVIAVLKQVRAETVSPAERLKMMELLVSEEEA